MKPVEVGSLLENLMRAYGCLDEEDALTQIVYTLPEEVIRSWAIHLVRVNSPTDSLPYEFSEMKLVRLKEVMAQRIIERWNYHREVPQFIFNIGAQWAEDLDKKKKEKDKRKKPAPKGGLD